MFEIIPEINYSLVITSHKTGISAEPPECTMIYLDKFFITTWDNQLTNKQAAKKAVNAIVHNRSDLTVKNIQVVGGKKLSLEIRITEHTHFDEMVELFEELQKWDSILKGILPEEWSNASFKIKFKVYGQY